MPQVSQECENRSSAGTSTVFVVDDDEAVRRSLVRLIRSTGLHVEAFGSAGEFLDRPSYSGNGCVIVDVSMPGMSGLELLQRMNEREFSLPVIFLTGHGDVPTGIRAMKKGAVDFLLKPVDDEILLPAIDAALRLHSDLRKDLIHVHEIKARIAQLSPREHEVMVLVIGGHLNKKIGIRMGISEKTVKTHRGRVMEKMEARSVADLVRFCLAAGVPPG